MRFLFAVQRSNLRSLDFLLFLTDLIYIHSTADVVMQVLKIAMFFVSILIINRYFKELSMYSYSLEQNIVPTNTLNWFFFSEQCIAAFSVARTRKCGCMMTCDGCVCLDNLSIS